MNADTTASILSGTPASTSQPSDTDAVAFSLFSRETSEATRSNRSVHELEVECWSPNMTGLSDASDRLGSFDGPVGRESAIQRARNTKPRSKVTMNGIAPTTSAIFATSTFNPPSNIAQPNRSRVCSGFGKIELNPPCPTRMLEARPALSLECPFSSSSV